MTCICYPLRTGIAILSGRIQERLIFEGLSMSEPVNAIYHPPRPGLPYLVVTFAAGELFTIPAQTQTKARFLAYRKSIAARNAKITRQLHERD